MNPRLEAPVRFPETFCSQCGRSCGPGNWGHSHCEDHRKETHEARAARGEPVLTPLPEFDDGFEATLPLL